MGDSDDDLLPEEDEDGEESSLPFTSDDLLRLRRLERQRQLAQKSEKYLHQDEEDQPPEQPYLPSMGSQPLASLPSRAASAPVFRRPVPFPPPRRPTFTPGPPLTTSAEALSGWRSLRLHSHWLIPVALVTIFFLLLLFTHPEQAGAMLFIFAAIGLIQAAILLYAPNDAFWAVGVVGGFVVLVAATFFVLFLPIFALILSILLLSLGGVALRERYYPVREGTVAVMGLFGRYNRTLVPGFNLRVPGEKALGVVETQSIRYDVRVPPIILVSGEQVTLSVAITYQVVPGEEHLAIRLTKDWQKPVQQQLQAVVQDEISMLSIQDFRYSVGAQPSPRAFGEYDADESENDQDASPLERINDHLTHAMRRKIAERGVAVHEVKVHLLESPHMLGGMPASTYLAPSTHQAVALPATPPNAGQVVEGSVQSPAIGDLPFYLDSGAGMMNQPPFHPAGPPVAPPPLGMGMGIPQAGAQPQQMSLLSAQALAETYDAVVRHRISDLATIQRIIGQFEAVAADPELSQQVPFDAAAGARNLSNHLYHLQMRSISQLGQPPNTDTSLPPDAPAGQEEQEEQE